MSKKTKLDELIKPLIIGGGIVGGYFYFSKIYKQNKILASKDLGLWQKHILKKNILPNLNYKNTHILYEIVTDETLSSLYKSREIKRIIKDLNF